MNFLIDNNNNVMWSAGAVLISFLALIVSCYSIYNSNNQNKKNRKANTLYKRRLDELTSLKQNVLDILKLINEDKSYETNLTSYCNRLKSRLAQISSTLNREEKHVLNFSNKVVILIVSIAEFENKESSNIDNFQLFMAEVSGSLDIAFRDYEVEEEKEIDVLL